MMMTFEQSVLTCISLAAVAVLAAMGVVVCVTEFHLSAIRQSLQDFRRHPWYVQLFLVAFVSHLVVYGSVKTNQTNSAGGDVTNAPPMMLMAPRPAVASVGDSGSQDLQPHTFPHWRHGVYEDGQRVGFDEDWVFPSGTNHLSSVEVMSWGEILPNGFSTTPIAELGCRVSLVPEVSEFHYCRTTSNSYRFVWNNARDRRINGSPISGCIELFRNGDVFVGTNGVRTVTPYVIPFHHDGFGQDEVWVRANFTNAEEILSAGYANWVDDQVGIDLTNGLFKFTAYFPEVPPEATELVVGDYSVCVTNSGEYVFVFEKGNEYSFHTEPYDETVEYSMLDDMAPSAPVFMSMWGGEPPYEWSIDGGGYWLDYPGYGYLGYFGWLPTLQGSPNVSHLGPDDFPITFEAILSDYCGSAEPSFHWSASDESIVFSTPNAQSTDVSCSSLPGLDSFMMSVSADLGAYSLWSHLSLSYETKRPYLNASPASEIVCFYKGDGSQKMVQVTFSYLTDSAGTFNLAVIGDDVQIVDEQNVLHSDGAEWRIESPCEDSKTFLLARSDKSTCDDGTKLTLSFTSVEGGTPLVCEYSVVFVEVSTLTFARNPTPRSRRRIGIGEIVRITTDPALNGMLLTCDSPGAIVRHAMAPGNWNYRSGFDTANEILRIAGVESTPVAEFSVVEPEGYRAVLKQITATSTLGMAGSFASEFDLYLKPEDVSFSALDVVEEGMVSTNAFGYFARPQNAAMLDHSLNGANVWCGVYENIPLYDKVAVCEFPPPWDGGGAYSWPIPNKWRAKADHSICRRFCNTDQAFELDANGTVGISKFGYTISCTTNRIPSYISGGN